MLSHLIALRSYLKANDIKFIDLDERAVSVRYSGENFEDLNVFIIFDEDDSGTVQLRANPITGLNGDKLVDALLLCNICNMKYRWVRFYLDSDNDLTLDIDAVTDIGTCGAECFQLIYRIVSIWDDVYTDFMKIKLGLK